MEHQFGGEWTLLKLQILEDYLKAYATALKKQNFRLLYIDAFAGSGVFTPKDHSALGDSNHIQNLPGITDAPSKKEVVGSALRALNVDRFDSYLFIEKDASRYRELKSACAGHPAGNKAHVENDDANLVLQRFLRSHNWRNWRAVLFLDPYGMSVEWNTLKAIADSKAIDLWYLFPISGMNRNTPNKLSRMDSSKRNAVTRMLGDDAEWEQCFYKEQRQDDLFGDDPEMIRTASIGSQEEFVAGRLGLLFPMVTPPLRLPLTGSQLYSLFFAVSNESGQAQGIAKRIASHILKSAQTTGT